MKITRFLGLLILLFVVFAMSISFLKPKETKILGLVSPTVEVTPSASVSATLFPSASISAEVMAATVSAEASVSATPSPTKKITPKPTPTPTAEAAEIVYGLVERFASQYGVDPDVLRHMAICESGFRSNAVNGPYVGLYQFNSSTWSNTRKEMDEDSDPLLRFSAEESIQTAAYALSKGRGKIWPNCVP